MTEEDYYEEQREKAYYEEHQRVEAAKLAAQESSDFLAMFDSCSTYDADRNMIGYWAYGHYDPSYPFQG